MRKYCKVKKQGLHTLCSNTIFGKERSTGAPISSTSSRAYLLIFWGGCYDIIHEYGKQLSHSSYSSSESAIWSTTARCLSTLLGLVYPLSCYRVYDIEDSKFVCSGCLLEVCVNFLDEDGFGLE